MYAWSSFTNDLDNLKMSLCEKCDSQKKFSPVNFEDNRKTLGKKVGVLF